MPTISIHDNSPTQVDKPDKCAALVALPLDKEQFLQKLRSGEEGNFAKCFRSDGRAKLPDDTVAQLYERNIDLARSVLAEVRTLGVRVVTNARPEDLANLLPAYRVLTLFAHSRDARFLESDIVDLQLILGELEMPDSMLSKLISEFRRGCPSVRAPELGAPIYEAVDFLNRLLEPTDTNQPRREGTRRLGEITRRQSQWRERRLKLELALPGAFRRGASIEFSDGFRRLDDILQSLPPEYEGTLDLTCCNSTIFAEDIRRKYRKCLVLSNELPTSLEFRLAIYRQVIRRLSREPQSYEEAVYLIRTKVVGKGGHEKNE
jgi:hypothetical protein